MGNSIASCCPVTWPHPTFVEVSGELLTTYSENEIPLFSVISFILASKFQSSGYPSIIPDNVMFAF